MPYLHYCYSIGQPKKIVRSPPKRISIKLPVFHQDQRVIFIGGSGIIRSCKSEAGTWNYLVEMALGAQPVFGRVGAETMLVLTEADLAAA